MTMDRAVVLRFVSAALLALAPVGCALHQSATSAPSGPLLPPALTADVHARQRTFGAPPQQGVVQHVVIVMQENRSFNYLFKGYPGATTASSGLNHLGQTVRLKAVSLAAPYDIDHGSTAFFTACDGTGSIPGTNCKMDGFDQEAVGGGGGRFPQYAFAPRSEVQLYWDMAKQYVLADDMHTSHLDASFVSHQYLIAAQANREVDLPSANWGCGGGTHDIEATLNPDRSYGSFQSPCQNYTTLGDLLDAASLPWRFYAAGSGSDIGYIWSAYQAIRHIYHKADWKADVVSPPSQFLTDVGNGRLAAVTWVLPTWQTSDHPGALSTMGPQWIASIVDAVGQSQFWNSSAIFIMWDEWGGWYDPVAPPYVDYDGLGMRVALLMISPYAKRGYVSHVQYEHGSILRFAEDAFGLPQLSAADARATDPAYDAFDFSKKPRTFRAFSIGLPAGFFQHLRPSMHALDTE